MKFWFNVEKTSTCWLWHGYITRSTNNTKGGYGLITVGNKTTTVHRLSWNIHFGPIPIGMDVCHSCDVRNCVNPKHLFLGTPYDNTQDMIRKGRQAINGNSTYPSRTRVVTNNLIKKGINQSTIARKLGVSRQRINQIILGY